MRYRVQTGQGGSWIVALAALVIVVVFAALPFFGSRSLMQDLFFVFTMLTLAQFWNLLAGYGGLVSVGQQMFVGAGAYGVFAAAILWGINPVAGLAVSAVAALVLALVSAVFVFRLNDAYFAIGTWVVAEVARLSFAQWKAVGGGTGTSLPREARRNMWGADWVEQVTGLRAAAAMDVVSYWLALALVVATIGGIYWLMRRKTGLALAAMRDNPQAAASAGLNAGRIKLAVYVISAVGAGIAGGLIFMQNGRVSPDSAFSVIDWTAYVIFIVVIGGIGTIEGPIIGVIVFFLLQSLLADLGSWYLMVLGLLGILIMLFAPRGLWGLISGRTGFALFPIQRRLFIEERED
ncbi:branched-chain amino acid ABC transporter permease [Pseudooceanicola sp. 216_PA32_1]|uniref:Branched-chain amino acid ABC transporter permease n=1 Tax=Pseudooceanicola pacificus TaxID=2676438 RepID=A0A844WFA3_9RHOB|nr:branched-chain amino acid ABC transporter permease [Pseudooceanicola pacificus]MWB79030.1 branched-chain amino acid ABC transporter permease [Pseudooceanicola pacificus]